MAKGLPDSKKYIKEKRAPLRFGADGKFRILHLTDIHEVDPEMDDEEDRQIPIKKNLCMRLDKRLYSKFNKNGIYLISNKSIKRCFATLCLYPKIEKLFNSYPTSDPLIFFKNNEFYLSVSFKLPEQVKQNENTLGIDLGCRRLVTTSNGDAIKSTDYLRQKRKIRYLKRILNSKKKNSHSARTKLKKIKHKEHNCS